jgi:hypothetical protein
MTRRARRGTWPWTPGLPSWWGADVGQAVRYASAHRMRITPEGTGHGAEPLDEDGRLIQALNALVLRNFTELPLT